MRLDIPALASIGAFAQRKEENCTKRSVWRYDLMHMIRKKTATVFFCGPFCGPWQKFCLNTDKSVFSTSGHACDGTGFGQMEGFHRDEAEEEKNASNCPWVK